MTIGGSIDIHFEESIQDLTKHLSKRQRRGTWAALVAQSPDGVAMAEIQIPSVLQPWDMSDLYSALESEMESQALIKGMNLEEAGATTIVRLFPESGEIDFETKAYAPKYEIPFRSSKFKVDVLLGNPAATYG